MRASCVRPLIAVAPMGADYSILYSGLLYTIHFDLLITFLSNYVWHDTFSPVLLYFVIATRCVSVFRLFCGCERRLLRAVREW